MKKNSKRATTRIEPVSALPTLTEELQHIQRDVGLILADVDRAKQQTTVPARVTELHSAVRGMDTVLKDLGKLRDALSSVLDVHRRLEAQPARARTKPLLITILRSVPMDFYKLMCMRRVRSVADAIQYLLFVYEMLPSTPRLLAFDDKDVNRYTFMFASTYTNSAGVLDWAKVERDLKGEEV